VRLWTQKDERIDMHMKVGVRFKCLGFMVCGLGRL